MRRLFRWAFNFAAAVYRQRSVDAVLILAVPLLVGTLLCALRCVDNIDHWTFVAEGALPPYQVPTAAERQHAQDMIVRWEIALACDGAVAILLLYRLIRSLRKWWLRRSFAVAGHCPACGYDLRATPDRCPECGAVPTAKGAKA